MWIPITLAAATLLAGCYTTPAIYAEVKAVFTNTVPVDAYRGAGRPEATYLIERLVDVAAKQCGFNKLELRRRNFIPTDAFPYQTPVALQYDSGDYFSTMDQALETAGWHGFEARRAELLARLRARLTDRGAGQPTLRELAVAAGCSVSTLAHYFGRRNDVVLAVFARVAEDTVGSLALITHSTPLTTPIPVTTLAATVYGEPM